MATLNLLSVVTAVHEGARPYISHAYESLIAQELPQGWAWEWCVQEDGHDVRAHDALSAPNDPRIRLASSRAGGPAVARTMAFARSKGSLIKVLDADDVLAPGALARDIAALTEHADIGWTTCRVLDLMPDGETVGYGGDPAPGLIPRGEVFSYWRTTRRPQVHPATLCVRRELVDLLGGWMAIPASEDTGLLTALSVLTAGFFVPEVGLHYRKHAAQSTALPEHSKGAEWEARMSVIEARAEALRSMTANN
ncbi:glycosyltransferase family 2 protein [Streptomyces sp. NPDC005227]|uniref:glycosyltransferase family 2 protein n=1 Tax=Streptomyces sp. NPDC005227 TaxID=3364707 RepID=UPI0036C5E6A4